MNDRSLRTIRPSRVRKAVAGVVEALEARAYLSGVVLGNPVNLATSSDNIAPVFANVADFNNDGKADLFVANSTNSVSVLTSNGDGSFQTPDTIAVAGTPLPLATGHFTSSGNLDIVAGTTGSPGNISVILGNGNGTFQAATNVPALDNNQAIAVGDFNNDGHTDVISVSGNSTASNNAMLLLGTGTGGLTAQAPFSLPFGNVASVGVGDFNGDGNLDFVVVNQLNNSVSVFMGKGNGTFQAPVTYATGPSPTSLAIGDFNGQTLGNGMPKLDIVTADSTGGEVSFLGNNGDGTFAAPMNSPVAGSGPGGGPLKVRSANFTGASSSQDLVVLLSPGSSGDATVLLGNGNGTFRTGTVIATHGGTRNAIAAGDISGDGLTDVVLTNSSQVSALLNTTNQDTTAPTAAVNASQLPGSTSSSTYNFTVTYTDAQQIDASTIGNNNLVVTYPDSSQHAATLVSTNLGNAATVTATYSIPFSSTLTTSNEGTYQVSINANSVKNANGVAVAAGNIGSFNLTVTSSDVTAPSAAVDPVQAPGSNQSTTYNFTVTYSDNVAINASTIATGNLLVTFPGNTRTSSPTLVSTGLTNAGAIDATYQITFPSTLTTANNGGYQVSINANSVLDTSGNPVPAGSIGTFTLTVTNPDTVPPIAAVDATQATPSTAVNTYNFTVTYADNVDVSAATLGNGNLTVTYPDGSSHAATLVSTGLTSAPALQATYQVSFPANISSSNNGTYTVLMTAGSVKDTTGNAVAAGSIGTFVFALPSNQMAPTGVFAVSAPTGKLLASVVSGSIQKSGASVTVTYNGVTTLKKAVIAVNLYTSSTQIHDGSATQVATVTKKISTLKPGKSYKIHFGKFTFPATAGSYYLVSDVALNGTLNSYDGATPTPIAVQAAFVDGDAVAVAPVKSTIPAGKKSSVLVTIENLGNVVYSGAASIDVSVIPVGGGTATLLATAVPVKLKLNPSQTKKVRITFLPGTLPASGSYNIQAHLNLTGDANAANDTVLSSAAVTI